MTHALIAEPDLLTELDALTPRPYRLAERLARLGYQPAIVDGGVFARGTSGSPVLMAPLHSDAAIIHRGDSLTGRHVGRAATVAAILTTIAGGAARPSLLFLEGPAPLPPGVTADRMFSLQGGVVPRLWRNCFGSVDMMIRVAGRAPHPGQPNMAVNAIEGAFPVLDALMRLKDDVPRRASRRPFVAEAPLLPRLSIVAAHGGLDGGLLPTLFDIVVNRRYDPAEDMDAVIAEIRTVATKAAPDGVRVGVSVTEHRQALPDPDLARRSAEDRALAEGWGWPQLPFCSDRALVPDAIPFGGLERPGEDPASLQASTTLPEVAALCRALRALLDSQTSA